MARSVWTSWKTRLAACLVALLLGALLGVLLTMPAPSFLAGSAATSSPRATLAPVTPTAPPLSVPAGWAQVLPGLILSDNSHFDTLMTSAVQPGRIAACALAPSSWPIAVTPVFVLSDDGGRTWQQRPITLAG